MFDINIISIHRIESDGTILYEEKFSDDFSSLFYSWKTNDGTLFVQFIEGDLENIVQFKPDGSIYIDGKKLLSKMYLLQMRTLLQGLGQ